MYIQLDNQILYYEKSGQGEPIILLHGNGGSHGEFDVLIADLELDYTVYAIDSSGQGLSARPREFHYQDMVSDLLHFMQELSIEKANLYGFSDGGIIGLLFASQHPDRVIRLMVSGANLTPKGLLWSARREIKRLFAKTQDPLLELMLKEPQISSEELSRISCPCLVLAGEFDLIRPKETDRIASAIPNAKKQIVPKETHSSYVLHSSKLAPILRKFMEPEKY